VAHDVTVTLVGDFMLERRLDSADIADVRKLFAGSGLVIANLDTVLSGQGAPMPKWANLRGPRELAGDLKTLGIDVAVLANNHAMDYGAEGLLDMVAALNGAGVATVGAGANLAEATAPLIVDVAGQRIAIVTVATTLAVGSEAGLDTPGVAPLHVRYSFDIDESLMAEQPGSVPGVKTWVDDEDLARVCADVRAARQTADTVLVVIHWGVPTPWRPSAHPVVQGHQPLIARALIDAGAAAVIGNHPHELQGIEFYAGCPIAYCLGNFWIDTIVDYPWMGHESIALQLGIGTRAYPTVAAQPLLLDGCGVPRLDQSGRTMAVLNDMSREFGVSIAPISDAAGQVSP
jgi:poly-gamma-glutamate capsule biosynthesis protein CapA/YwtB (metallophosphatase superfamily)